MDEGEHTTVGDGNVTEEFVEFFVISDGELDVSRNNSGLLVVTRGVTGKFKNFGRQIFKDGSQVDRGSSSDPSSISSISKLSVNTTDWKLKTSAIGSALG